jgi:hypothetical protein
MELVDTRLVFVARIGVNQNFLSLLPEFSHLSPISNQGLKNKKKIRFCIKKLILEILRDYKGIIGKEEGLK